MSTGNAVFQGSLAYPAPSPGPVVTIGNFDGVHLGHRALVDAARALAGPIGAPVAAFTFFPGPADVLRPGHGPPRLQTIDDRVACLFAAGCSHVVVEAFSVDYAQQAPEDFARHVLGHRLGARGVVVGWDFRFGRNRGGDAEGLRRWLGVPVVEVDPVEVEGVVVSSTRIRGAVLAGAVRDAAVLLGRPHDVVGTVVSGDRRGRTIGFPTANVRADTELLPAQGVYAVRADTGDGVLHAGVANLGTRPTFGSSPQHLEVHLLDYDGDLYGKQVRVQWIERIRGEVRFASVDELVARIHRDVALARELLG